MAFKQLEVPDLGTVKLYKRRKSKSIRLSVLPDGTVRVSLPYWAPYSAGLTFLKSKASWIMQQKAEQSTFFRHQQRVGKAHLLQFQEIEGANRVSTKIHQNSVVISYPNNYSNTSANVQHAAKQAVARALKKEADALLPMRLRQLSSQTKLPFRSVRTRSLKSRWGSCNQNKEITLNIYLMQLPWHLIDYVLIHELVHTKILHHGPKFWGLVEQYLPDTKQYRKAIKTYHPDGNDDEMPFAL